MPRSKEEFKAITEERKKSIVVTAIKLFALKGYDSVSVDDITKAAKCSHGLFYHYFSSKADLFNKIGKMVNEKWQVLIQEINFQQSPDLILKDITEFYIGLLKGNDSYAYVLYVFLTLHLQKNAPEIPHEHVEPKHGPFKTFPQVLKEGIEKGIFINGDVVELCRIYYSCLEGLTFNRIHLGKNKFKNVSSDLLCKLFLKKGE